MTLDPLVAVISGTSPQPRKLFRGRECYQNNQVFMLQLVATLNHRGACFHSAQWGDMTLNPLVAVISGTSPQPRKLFRGRECYQNNQVFLLRLVARQKAPAGALLRLIVKK